MSPSSDTTPPEGALLLHLDGFDGPMDLLLELARAQKVDLARISIVSLVDQFLAVLDAVRRLELAADWLVMAAWLTWLKSRLLLPPGTDEADEGEMAAGMLAARLTELQTLRAAAAWLDQRPILGRDVFRRGAAEDMMEIDRSRLAIDMPGLLRAYLAALRRAGSRATYRPAPAAIWTVKDALARLQTMVGALLDWSELSRFLPDREGSPLEHRSAMASTLLGALELARNGAVRLRQDSPFGPILVRGGPA